MYVLRDAVDGESAALETEESRRASERIVEGSRLARDRGEKCSLSKSRLAITRHQGGVLKILSHLVSMRPIASGSLLCPLSAHCL